MPHQNSAKRHIKIPPNATSKFCQMPHLVIVFIRISKKNNNFATKFKIR